MGDKSAIEWTDATWNPVTGCSKVSPGCAHCYAATLAPRLARMGQRGYTELPWVPENAAANVFLHEDRLQLPLRWTRPRRVFVNSMSDLFHELVPDEFIDRVFAVMAQASHHTFQVLTKRPERMRAWAAEWSATGDAEVGIHDGVFGMHTGARFANGIYRPWPLPNVWLGTSVENQTWADRRIPLLLDTPAAVRFLSCEPLLGPVDLRLRHPVMTDLADLDPGRDERYRGTYPFRGVTADAVTRRHHWIDWVIVGGESGPDHRPVDPAWVRSMRDQCVATGVPFLFKQWGGRTSKSGGRELDGRTWDEYPETESRAIAVRKTLDRPGATEGTARG